MILDLGTENEDGSYSGTKIISTGIPAKICYERNTACDYYDTTLRYPAYNASKTLLENFENLKFDKIESGETITANAYHYNDIINTKPNNDKYTQGYGSIFLTNDAKSVHALGLDEANEIREKLGKERLSHDGAYTRVDMTSDGCISAAYPYWLFDMDGFGYVMYEIVDETGYTLTEGYAGIRPVVTLKDNIKFERNEMGVWQIKS